jgi:hypothetical protein
MNYTGSIEGNIMRKSLFLGNWEMRHVRIDSSGLRSHKAKNMLPTVTFPRIQELWTRFEFMQGYFIIKCMVQGMKY